MQKYLPAIFILFRGNNIIVSFLSCEEAVHFLFPPLAIFYFYLCMCYGKSSIFYYYSPFKYFFPIPFLSHSYWCYHCVHVMEKDDKNGPFFFFSLPPQIQIVLLHAVAGMFNLVSPDFVCWKNSSGEKEGGLFPERSP